MTKREMLTLARRAIREPDLEDEEAVGGMTCLFCGSGMHLEADAANDSPRVCNQCAQEKLSDLSVAVIKLLKPKNRKAGRHE